MFLKYLGTTLRVLFLRLLQTRGMIPKISPERIQVRFSTGYVEGITEKLEPHLNHVPRNSLIINEFNILHREIKV